MGDPGNAVGAMVGAGHAARRGAFQLQGGIKSAFDAHTALKYNLPHDSPYPRNLLLRAVLLRGLQLVSGCGPNVRLTAIKIRNVTPGHRRNASERVFLFLGALPQRGCKWGVKLACR